MTDSMRNFDDRLRRIDGGTRRRAGPMRFQVDEYGTVRARRGHRGGLLLRLLRWLAAIVIALFAFKVAAYAVLGVDGFTARADALAAGSPWDRVVGLLMQPDPVTEAAGSAIAPYLGG